jgi:hypothetical protein
VPPGAGISPERVPGETVGKERMADNGNKREIRAGRMVPFNISIRLERGGGQADMSKLPRTKREARNGDYHITHYRVAVDRV